MDLIERETPEPPALLCCDARRAAALRDGRGCEQELEEAMVPLRTLASPVRLRLVASLHDLGELCVCDAAWICEMSVALASHHLKALREAGLVDRRRSGKLAMYQLSPRGTDLVRFVLKGAA